jgi:hypothetical protein
MTEPDDELPETPEMRLERYLDGDLSPEERVQFEDELKGDPSLAARLDARRGAVSLLRSAGPERPPRHFVFMVAERARTERRRHSAVGAEHIVAIISVALLIALSWVAFHGIDGSAPVTSRTAEATLTDADRGSIESVATIDSIAVGQSGSALSVRVRPTVPQAAFETWLAGPGANYRPATTLPDGRVDLTVSGANAPLH